MQARSRQSTLEHLWSILRRRIGLVLVGFALPFAAVVGLATFLPGMYQARAVVLVEPPLLPTGSDDTEARLHKLTQENLSRSRLEALLEQLDLYADERRAGPEQAAAAIRRDVVIETQKIERPGGRSSIGVEITFRGGDAAKVASVANELSSYYLQAERRHWEAQIQAILAELNQAGKHLAEQEERIAAYQKEHLGELPQQVAIHLAAIGGLNGQLDTIRRRRVDAMERSRVLGQKALDPQRPAVDPNAKPDSPQARLERLEDTAKELKSRYTAEHPDVIRINQEIQFLKKQVATGGRPSEVAPATNPLATKAAKDLQEMQGKLAGLSQDEKTVQQQIDALEGRALNAPRRAQELAALLPPYEAAETAYRELLRRYEEVRLLYGENGDRGPFRVLEEAVVPTHPTVPNRGRLMMIGAVLSMLIAAAAVALAEHLDGGFHDATDLGGFTRLPVLATIPHIVTSADRKWTRANTIIRTAPAAIAVAYIVYGTYLFAHDNAGLVRMLDRGHP